MIVPIFEVGRPKIREMKRNLNIFVVFVARSPAYHLINAIKTAKGDTSVMETRPKSKAVFVPRKFQTKINEQIGRSITIIGSTSDILEEIGIKCERGINSLPKHRNDLRE